MNLVTKILLEYRYKFQHVKSSNIKAIAYNEEEEILQVKFLSGSVYEYYDVPKRVYKDFIRAKSKGRYLYYNIRFDYYYDRVK